PAPLSVSAERVRGADVRAVPRHPLARADADDARLPRACLGRPARRQVVAPERRVGQLRHRQAGDSRGSPALRRALVLAAVIAGAWPGVAWAHASLVKTEPADGAVLAGPPAQVRVFFD